MRLDSSALLAEHGAMDSTPPIAPPPTSAALAAWRALALVLAVVLAALGFAAYTQPELLLNYTGLRYCG